MPCPLMDPPRSVQAIRNRGKPQVSHPLVSQNSTLQQKSKDFGEDPSWLLEYNTAIRPSTKRIIKEGLLRIKDCFKKTSLQENALSHFRPFLLNLHPTTECNRPNEFWKIQGANWLKQSAQPVHGPPHHSLPSLGTAIRTSEALRVLAAMVLSSSVFQKLCSSPKLQSCVQRSKDG